MRLSSLGDWLVYFLVRLMICVIQSLPPATCLRLSRGLTYIFCDLLRIRHAVVDENLRHAFPEATAVERQRIEQGMWRHLFTMICEIALAQRKIHETNWRQHASLRNKRQLVLALMHARPLVVVTAHFGNFEMSGYLAGLLGFPTYTIARPLDNRFLHEFLLKFRGATGQYVLSTKGSGERAQAVLECGETLALLGDHFGGKKGCWVEFFNRPASCHKAISVFSLANKAPIAVVYTPRTGDFLKFEMVLAEMHDPAAEDTLGTIPEMTQWYNEHIEIAVQQIPEQYWWLHNRWKDPRPKKTRAADRTRRLDTAEVPAGPVTRRSDKAANDAETTVE